MKNHCSAFLGVAIDGAMALAAVPCSAHEHPHGPSPRGTQSLDVTDPMSKARVTLFVRVRRAGFLGVQEHGIMAILKNKAGHLPTFSGRTLQVNRRLNASLASAN